MFKSDEQGERYECDHCGARLPAPTSEGTRTCSYCGSVYTTKQDAQAPGGYTFVVQSPPTIDISQFYNSDAIVSATKSTAKWGCFSSVLITVLVLAAVAVPLYFGFKDSGFLSGLGIESGQPYNVSSNSGILLPGEPSSLQVAVRAQRYEGTTKAYLFGLGGSPMAEQWKSNALPDDVYTVPMAADAENVYAVENKRLIAIRRSDGAEVWQATISDTVTSCDDCIMPFGTTVVVRAGDGVLQGFTKTDGKQAWRKELESVSTEAAAVADGIVIGTGSSSDGSLVILNPADGTDKAVLDAYCSDGRSTSRASSNDKIQLAPDDTTFVVGFGTIPSCLQRWDAATGGLIWTQTLPSGTSFGTFNDSPAIWGPSLIAIPSGSDLMIVDRNTGAQVQLLKGDQEQLTPIGFTGESLVAIVEDQRGTRDFSVRGISTVSWQTSWEQALDGTPTTNMSSATVTSSETAVAVELVGTNVRLISFDGEQQDLVVSSVDTTTGAATGATTIDLTFTSTIGEFEELGWRGETAVLIIDSHVVAVDTASATITSTWP